MIIVIIVMMLMVLMLIMVMVLAAKLVMLFMKVYYLIIFLPKPKLRVILTETYPGRVEQVWFNNLKKILEFKIKRPIIC